MPLTTKKYKLNGNNRGFTLIEMVVVLLLISIIAAAVFTRSIGTNRINFVGQVDKIRNQIRYAQSLAMKGNAIWGIKSFGGRYWLFHYEGSSMDVNVSIKLPGEKSNKIDLANEGISMDSFTLFFDKIGVPYKSNLNTRINNTNDKLPINIHLVSDITQSRTLNVTPETGLVTTSK
jgi:prepilin-type N-terminal cleavage/methylation domain-containing protein